MEVIRWNGIDLKVNGVGGTRKLIVDKESQNAITVPNKATVIAVPFGRPDLDIIQHPPAQANNGAIYHQRLFARYAAIRGGKLYPDELPEILLHVQQGWGWIIDDSVLWALGELGEVIASYRH